MCGIAAIFIYEGDKRVDVEEVRQMTQQMVSRGPDGFGEWFDETYCVGLGHRRLSIIDLSLNGAQPMLSEGGRFAITFNGEIYNYQALREGLEKEGVIFRSGSDTEVLLQLYIHRGERMLDELRGMYAFVIWDGEKRGIFAARDPFGIKPLYYSDTGKCLRFASQVKALVGCTEVDRSPEPAGHAGFFLWGHVPEPWTLYKGIKALPAGSSLWLEEGGTRQVSSFASVRETLLQAQQGGGRENAAEILREALAKSVEFHMVADVPVGLFLSAGLDSGAIAGLASEKNENVNAVTLGFREFQGGANDETVLAGEVARHYRIPHQVVWISQKMFQEEGENLFKAMDQPTTDGVNSHFVSLAAKRAGMKVCLSGLGGDELFGGYPSFRDVPRAAELLQPLGKYPRFGTAFRSMVHPLLKTFSSPKYAGLLEYGPTYEGAYLLRRGMFMPWELDEVLQPEMAREGLERLQTIDNLAATVQGLNEPHLKIMALEMCWYMRNQLLRDADWAGMGHSIEIRVPFVDWELFKVVASLAAGSQPPNKLGMCRAPLKPLPDAILNRPKTGFHIPVRDWLQEKEPQRGKERGLRGWARYVYGHFAPK